jgi:tetratricopeptide (TPR) repeat protein
MDMQEAFDRGDFLTVAGSAQAAITPEEKLLVAISLFKLGKASDAMAFFREISDQVMKLSKVFLYMAQIHRDRGEPETAKFLLERYAHFYPDDDEAQGLLEENEEEPSLVSGTSPELARIYAAQGHFEQALDIYVSLLGSETRDPELEKEARKAQGMHIVKTLEGWLEKLRA